MSVVYKSFKFFLAMGLLFMFVGFSSQAHQAEGILLDVMEPKLSEYDTLEALINDADPIIEAEVVEGQIVEDLYFPTMSVSTLVVNDVLLGEQDLIGQKVSFIEHGDYRAHVDIVTEGETHLLFLRKAEGALGDLDTVIHDAVNLSEYSFLAVDSWQGKFNMTDEQKTYFYADRERIKPFQEQLASLPHDELKAEVRKASKE